MVLAKIPESLIIELASIVDHYGVGEAKATNDRLPYEVLHFGFGNVHQGFGLHPLSEVVDGDNDEFLLARGRRKWAKDVHSPLGEGLGGYQLCQRHGGLVLNGGVSLALVALSDKVLSFLPHGWPVVSLSKNFVAQESAP